MNRLRSRALFKIHPGKLDEFKRLAAECMKRARALDTGTISYEIFFSADETESVVYAEYVDSQPSIDHFQHMGELSAAIFAIVDAYSRPHHFAPGAIGSMAAFLPVRP